jgi:hypothetical protein
LTLKIDTELISSLIDDDNPDYKLFHSEIVDQGRWDTFYETVTRRLVDETYWKIYWSKGSTENQYNGVMVDRFCEVVPEEVKTIKFIEKEE